MTEIASQLEKKLSVEIDIVPLDEAPHSSDTRL
ncbi:hypothetical protein N186_07650 [Thermofilum adornatum]|uniref:Uncharacterized protein n=1 Tax=Thermofilum adornatum TaxID=1365176 RepID=S5ZFC9_9CREN|nr:hypothetical protein N186_07650 [Thermofilum adornatum]